MYYINEMLYTYSLFNFFIIIIPLSIAQRQGRLGRELMKADHYPHHKEVTIEEAPQLKYHLA